MELYIDASGTLGYDAFFKSNWFRVNWTASQAGRSIQWKELCAIVTAVTKWSYHLSRRRVRFYCNNQVIVTAWQKQSAKHPELFQLLFFVEARFNFTVCPSYTSQDTRTGWLMRCPMTFFFYLIPQANRRPVTTPIIHTELCRPRRKIWLTTQLHPPQEQPTELVLTGL